MLLMIRQNAYQSVSFFHRENQVDVIVRMLYCSANFLEGFSEISKKELGLSISPACSTNARDGVDVT